MGLALWLTISAGLALVIGGGLFVLGWRGRRLDEHPCCRRCGFDLEGLTLGVATLRCPECGRAVGEAGTRARRRAVRIGRRKRRPVVASVGAFLVVVLALPAGGLAWLVWSGANLDHYKPVWWLIHDGGSENDITAEGARDELRRRMVLGEMSAGGARAVARAALVRQAGPEAGWHAEWGTLFEIAWLGGWLDETMTDQYLRNAVRFEVIQRQFGGPAPEGALRLDLGIEDRTGSIVLLTVRGALRVPAGGPIGQAMAGEFNLAGRLGAGQLPMTVRPAGASQTRKQWFASIGVQTTSTPTAGPTPGFAVVGGQEYPAPSSIRLSPWPTAWRADLALGGEVRTDRQYLLAGEAGLGTGAVLDLEVLVRPIARWNSGTQSISSWWSQRPVPVGEEGDGVRWSEALRVGR